MWQDTRYAFRTLLKTPGVAAIAVLAIALGVGPNSAVFSIVHAVLLRPLPVGDPDRVVILWETRKARGLDQAGVSGPNFLDWKREARSFEDMVAANASPEYGFNLTGGGEPERVLGARAGSSFLNVLGITPVLGRGFRPEEDQPGGPKVALISYQLWQRRFSSDPAIAGRPIGLDGISHVVIGVLPAEFRSFGNVDIFVPQARDLAQSPRDSHNYGVLARLKPGVTPAQAQAEMNSIALRLEQQYPATNREMGAIVIPLTSIFGPIRPLFAVLFGAVGFLLLIACANVAALLLARGAARQREIAVRAALGAGAARLVRQLLAESLVLALIGGALGLLLAGGSIGLLRHALPDVIPRLKEMGINASVFAFTLAASILTGVLFGLFPALRLARTDVNQVLKEGTAKGVAGVGGQRTRSALLVVEVALAVALLIGSGLLIRSFANLTAVNPGFRIANLLTMRLTLPESKYGAAAKRAAFARAVLRRVEALPGVRSTSTISVLPLRTYFLNLPADANPYSIEGQPAVPPSEQQSADFRVVSRGVLTPLGIRLVRGRDFTDHDASDAPRVALVNEMLARLCCPGEDVLGKRLRIRGKTREIVGVIPDVRLHALDGKLRAAVFVPHEQEPNYAWTLLVHTSSDPAALSAAVRREILAEDNEQPVSDIRTMEEVVTNSLLLRRLSMSLLAVFATLALVLAGIGIYGLFSYTVSRRTQEIGLRLALGAGREHVLRLVVGQGLLIGLAGVALGVAAALAITRLLRGLLFGVTATDPVVFLSVPILLLVIVAIASYIPARRAMRIDPMAALRYE